MQENHWGVNQTDTKIEAGCSNMKMFLLKSFCLLALMFISVLAGIQIADEGIHHMKGKSYSDLSIEENDPSSHDLQVKQQRLNQMNEFNLFSFMGKKMSEGISNASAKIIKSIAK